MPPKASVQSMALFVLDVCQGGPAGNLASPARLSVTSNLGVPGTSEAREGRKCVEPDGGRLCQDLLYGGPTPRECCRQPLYDTPVTCLRLHIRNECAVRCQTHSWVNQRRTASNPVYSPPPRPPRPYLPLDMMSMPDPSLLALPRPYSGSSLGRSCACSMTEKYHLDNRTAQVNKPVPSKKGS